MPYDLQVGLLGNLDGFQHHRLGQLACASLHHQDAVAGARYHEVEHTGLQLLEGRVYDELAVGVPHARGPQRALEGDVGDAQRGGGAYDRENVQGVLLVRGERGDDHLDLVAESLGEEGADGPVRQSVREDGVSTGAALPSKEVAGNLTPRVELLLEVDGEGEEVDALPGLRHRRSHQQNAVSVADDYGAVGLLGQLACLELEGIGADGALEIGHHSVTIPP